MGAATHILTVDVGNTTTRLGVYTLPVDREDAAAPELIGACDLTTPDRATADELRIQLAQAQGILPMAELAGSILSCVVPTLTETWRHALASVAQTRPLVVGPGLKSGIRMRYNDPSEVGADRIAGIVAARAAYELPAVVVDLGTNNFYDDKRSTADTVSDLQRLFTLMHDRMPDTHIYYFSIAQRLDTAFAGNVSAVNDRMEEWCRYKDWITFIDVEEQVTVDKLRDDHVHPLPETYRDIYLPALRAAGWEG